MHCVPAVTPRNIPKNKKGQITVEAAQKMGELLLQIQKNTDFHGNQHTEVNTDTTANTKSKVIADIGIERHAASDYQQMALHPEQVQVAIQKAIERGDVVSRAQVMKEIRDQQRTHSCGTANRRTASGNSKGIWRRSED